jgi:hypothetical protein
VQNSCQLNWIVIFSQPPLQSSAELPNLNRTHPLTNQLLHFTSLHFAGLGSSLYILGADPKENTAFDICSVVMGGCLAIVRISFPRNGSTEPLPSKAYSLSRSLYSNGTARYNINNWERIFWIIERQMERVKANVARV